MTAMAIISGIGMVVQAVGQIRQANQQASALRYNQQVQEADARISQQQAEAQAAIDTQNSARVKGEIATDYGEAGVDVGSGSPLEILSFAASQAELTRQSDFYRGKIQQLGYLTQAQALGVEASSTQSSGPWNAAGTILTDTGKIIQNMGGAGPTVPASDAVGQPGFWQGTW